MNTSSLPLPPWAQRQLELGGSHRVVVSGNGQVFLALNEQGEAEVYEADRGTWHLKNRLESKLGGVRVWAEATCCASHDGHTLLITGYADLTGDDRLSFIYTRRSTGIWVETSRLTNTGYVWGHRKIDACLDPSGKYAAIAQNYEDTNGVFNPRVARVYFADKRKWGTVCFLSADNHASPQWFTEVLAKRLKRLVDLEKELAAAEVFSYRRMGYKPQSG
jgi:hypothetical protein